MPIKLIPPRKGFSPYYYGRGTHLGVFVDRSTKCLRPALAKRVIKGWEDDIERGRFAETAGPTFLSAALAYKALGGEDRFIARLVAHFGEAPLRPRDLSQDVTLEQHWQQQIDAAAATLMPSQSAATRNREIYTPASAILKQAGLKFSLTRPKGSRGRMITDWLWPEQAARLIDEAYKIDAEFGAFLVFLCYTGCRLNEGLKLTCDNTRLAEAEGFLPTTKNGDPRRVYLPETVVAALANHPRGLDRGAERVFRFTKSGRLYAWLKQAAKAAEVTLPERSAFHIFCHTYATWMRRFAGMDTKGLVGTGRWRSEQSASRYQHTVVSEESKRADLLPAVVKIAR
jgi:hypothetical protein